MFGTTNTTPRAAKTILAVAALSCAAIFGGTGSLEAAEKKQGYLTAPASFHSAFGVSKKRLVLAKAGSIKRPTTVVLRTNGSYVCSTSGAGRTSRCVGTKNHAGS